MAELDVRPGDCALEIGFGGGLTLERLLAVARYVCGVDRSADAVASASSQFVKEIERGAAEFMVGSVEELPLPAGSFDKVLTVNTVYFWTSLEAGMGEIRRVLTPGGRVVIGSVPKSVMDKMNMPPDIFTPREPEELVAALSGAGFAVTKIEAPNGPAKAMLAVGETVAC